MNTLVIVVCLVGPLFAFQANNLLGEHGPPIRIKKSSRSTKKPELRHIIQRVDNFNASDLRTWTMRYYSNDEFFQKGGPMFIFLGGEWNIDALHGNELRGGQMFDMARKHNGYMFYTEHRYYGYSYPTSDTSTENLKYLNVEQALADVVYFVQYVKRSIEGLANSKVVVLGCSYAANMATWIRLKYPNAIDAAYASSGPVKAVADFYEFYEVVGDDIGLVSQECKEKVSDAIAELARKMDSESGISEMSKTFNISTSVPIQNAEPYRSHFFLGKIDLFAGLAQREGLDGLREICRQILLHPGTALEKLINITKRYYNKESYRDTIKTLSDVRNSPHETRPWLYQTCTEFGYYQTTTSDKQPFGRTVALEYFIQMCTDLFGKNFGLETLQNGISRTNMLYGSTTPNVTKLVSIHGSVDPWHPLGILKDLNPLAPAIFIDGTTHCQDLKSVEISDPPALKAARRRAKDIIAEWIK